MSDYKLYQRTQTAEMREVTKEDIDSFNVDEFPHKINNESVSISETDFYNGSPKIGDMIARNPSNHNDKWLVAKEYFEKNFKKI